MKKLITAVLFIIPSIWGMSQPVQATGKGKTYEFKTKDNKPIEITSLATGDQTFTGADGSKVVITIGNAKVAAVKFYTPDGKQINALNNSTSRFSDTMLCRQCTVLRMPGGKTERYCVTAPCPTANGISKGLSNDKTN